MEGQPITTNPVLIMLINMTIVFSVLVLLGCVIELIHRIDPTKAKKVKPAPVAAPPKVQPAVIETPQVVSEQDAAALAMEEKTIKAVITTAIMASGYKDFEIVSIRKLD